MCPGWSCCPWIPSIRCGCPVVQAASGRLVAPALAWGLSLQLPPAPPPPPPQVLTRQQQEQAAHNNFNFDHPDAFDFDLIISTLKKLKQGKSVKVPIYDFTTHSRKKDWVGRRLGCTGLAQGPQAALF